MMTYLAVGFVLGLGVGGASGVIACLGRARRFRHDGKVLRKASAQLVLAAEGIQKKAHHELEQARELKAQVALVFPGGLPSGPITEEQNLQLLRGGRD